MGFVGAVLVGKTLPDGGNSAWALLVVIPLFVGIPAALVGILYATEWIASHITAACPAADCTGRVHALKRGVFRCDRCASEFEAKADAGSEFDSIVRRNEAKIASGLAERERGSVSVSEPDNRGAVSPPRKESQ